MRYTPILRCFIPFCVAICAYSADWNPRAAADYMDARQKDWFVWPRAQRNGAACMSCHTGLTYFLVRPELRGVLGEGGPNEYERGFSASLRAHVTDTMPTDATMFDNFGTNTVLRAFLITTEDHGKLTPDVQKALDQLWVAQQPDGGWAWFSLNDDPWEMPESRYFGASLGALAIGSTPAEYRAKPEVQEHIARLTKFFQHDEGQPLHHRLALLWASSKLPEMLPGARKKAILDQARQTQQADGGWTMNSLGPWRAKTDPPISTGSNAYATAFTAFTLQQAGVAASDPMLGHAIEWLRKNQDAGGYWDAPSMNHKYEAGSMMERFMRDAATGYASLVLLHAGQSHVDHSARP